MLTESTIYLLTIKPSYGDRTIIRAYANQQEAEAAKSLIDLGEPRRPVEIETVQMFSAQPGIVGTTIPSILNMKPPFVVGASGTDGA